eukprot:29120-Pelagococcus_subviridis.AAC.19
MSWISSRYTVLTGCVRPAAWTTGQSSRYPQNKFASSVALITINFNGAIPSSLRRAGSVRNSARRKSPSKLRSCISSNTTCDTSARSGSPCIRRRSIPAVINVSLVSFVTAASNRT